jgi:DNA phosphorothioation-dependent restriction protein DptG
MRKYKVERLGKCEIITVVNKQTGSKLKLGVNIETMNKDVYIQNRRNIDVVMFAVHECVIGYLVGEGYVQIRN